MDIIKTIIEIIAGISGGLAALMSILLFLQLSWPAPVLFFLKLYASALSLLLAFIGLLCTISGLATGSVFISVIGFYVLVIFFIHIFRVTRSPHFSGSFEHVFGDDWEKSIFPKQKKQFLSSRFILRLPGVPNPRFVQNIPYATVPETNRKLLCDVWQPPLNVTPSGLAFIYLHGSAWYLLDKDLGTRPFFSHLASQGHVIMDVAYRLAPETDMMGMVHDVKRAIFWMKEHSETYGINRNQIVVSGGSAGGHLALLAAYTATNPKFSPNEMEERDVSVSAVISMYGPTDLEAMYYHLNQHLTTRSTPGKPRKAVPTQMPGWVVKIMGNEYFRLGFDKGLVNAGAIAPLLGGHPDECPEIYALYSPVTHVHAYCPPTLLIHGEHDVMAPVKSTRLLHTLLLKEKVQAVMHIIPQTDHAFDLVLPRISPSAHSAIYDIERFLAFQVKPEKSKMIAERNEEYQFND